MKLAAIDIGSNAARMLICEAKPFEETDIDFTKLNLLRIPLRLGMDVFKTGKIGEERRLMFLQTMHAYKQLLDIYKVEHYRACATSAMRDASNSTEIIRQVREETGIEINLITGDEEAALLYQTHLANQVKANLAFLYVDVGGGSTELTLFTRQNVTVKRSFNIGTIRLLQNGVSTDSWEALKSFIKAEILPFTPLEIIGSGGNINKVFSLSKRAEGKAISLETIKEYYKNLEALTVEQRIHQYGLKEDRADVIVPALLIYSRIMRWAEGKEIFVPKIGLVDGIIKMLYQKHHQQALIKK